MVKTLSRLKALRVRISIVRTILREKGETCATPSDRGVAGDWILTHQVRPIRVSNREPSSGRARSTPAQHRRLLLHTPVSWFAPPPEQRLSWTLVRTDL